MADVGLNFPITADPAQAEAEVKRFRAFVNSQFAGVSSDVKSSASAFTTLRQSIRQNADTTRGALARALLEGKKNIGGLVSEAKSAQKEFDALEKAEARALKMATGSGGLFGALKSELSSGIAQTALGFFGGNLLTGAFTKLGAGLKEEVETGFDFLDLQERAKISFTTIFKNAGLSAEEAADKATKHLQELVDFGARTPFRTDQLIGLSQQLQAVGFKADEIVPTLRAVGDAVAGLGVDPEKLQRLITNLGQIKTTGQVSSRELREIALSGVNAWKYLAEYSGKSVEQVRKLAKKNQLDADVAVKVIVAGMGKEFQGLMKQTEGTYSSMWSTIHDLNQQRAAEAFKPAFDEVKKGQTAAILGLQSGAAEGFTKGAADVQKLVLGGFDKMLAGIASGDFKQLGFGALDAVVTGAKEGAKGLYGAGSKAGEQLEQGWRDKMQQHSPSLLMQALGFDAGQSLLFGFLNGVQDKATLERIEKAIQEAAQRFDLDPDLIRAVVKKESSFNPRAVSPAGAEGLMQLMPGTAARFDVKDPFNIEQNIMGGSKYLRELFDRFNGDLRLTLAAYNAGEGRGRSKTPEARLGKLYAENIDGMRDYVDTIIGNYSRGKSVSGPSFGSLSAGEQLRLLWQMPEFRNFYTKWAGSGSGGDLAGGTGTFGASQDMGLPAELPTGRDFSASRYLKPEDLAAMPRLNSNIKSATEAQ